MGERWGRGRERERCWTWNDLCPVSLTRLLPLERHERDTSWLTQPDAAALSNTLLLVLLFTNY